MSQGVIQGSMREAPLVDVIQLVCRGGKSGCFQVQQGARRARIWIRDGQLVHAETPGAEGLDALLEVAAWLDGSYQFEASLPVVPVSLDRPTTALLVAFGRRADEWRVLSQMIPSLDLYPLSSLLPGEAAEGQGPRQRRLLDLATGYCSVAELAELEDRPALDLAKDLYGLVLAGLVTLKGIRSGQPPGRGRAQEPQAAPEPPPPMPTLALPPAPAGDDAQRQARLAAFCERIAQTSRACLPEARHALVDGLLQETLQVVASGGGPEAVKQLALAISRGAVEAGCDGATVRTLNGALKALFNPRQAAS